MDASDLNQFTGTEYYHRIRPFTSILATDGVMYLAEKAQAHWLVTDIMAWHQFKGRNYPFLVVELKTHADKSAVLTVREDTGLKPVYGLNYDYTDFPLDSVKLYICNAGSGQAVIMLPSEY